MACHLEKNKRQSFILELLLKLRGFQVCLGQLFDHNSAFINGIGIVEGSFSCLLWYYLLNYLYLTVYKGKIVLVLGQVFVHNSAEVQLTELEL